jgi:rubrerythrin
MTNDKLARLRAKVAKLREAAQEVVAPLPAVCTAIGVEASALKALRNALAAEKEAKTDGN